MEQQVSTPSTPSQPPPSEPPTTPQNAPPAEAPVQEPAAAPSGDTPSTPDWRAQLAGEDTKALEQLARYKTPGDFWKSHTELRTKLSERPTALRLAEDATPEQIAEYREALGIETVAQDAGADAYVKALGVEVPEGTELSDVDTELLHGFAKDAYDKGHDPRVVNDAVNWYFEQSEAVKQALNERNGELKDEWQRALKEEYGRDYEASIEAGSQFLRSQVADEGERATLLNAQIEGGGRLGDHPAFAKLLVAAAMNSGMTDRIEANALESGGKSLSEQQAEIEKLQFDDPGRYNAKEVQARLDKIIGLRVQRGELDEFGNETKKRR